MSAEDFSHACLVMGMVLTMNSVVWALFGRDLIE